MGKTAVETPQDALDLAGELGADATLVAAITEYQPYDPPIVGVVMQWYARGPRSGVWEGFDRSAHRVRRRKWSRRVPVAWLRKKFSKGSMSAVRSRMGGIESSSTRNL